LILGNLNLSRSLGDLEYKQNKKLPPEEQMITAYPDVIVENLTDDCDFIIIGCDGVWDCKTNQEAVDFVEERLRKNPNTKLSKIIEDLFDEILAPDIYTGRLNINI
jgi:serine/threonine protein phosphatase PrpC